MNSVTKFLARITAMQWFVVLTVVTVTLVLALPPDPKALATLHVSSAGYRLALLILLIPYVVIWFFGFFAYGKLRSYVGYLHKSKEDAAFRTILLGMGVLAFGLIIPTAISEVLGSIAAHHTGFKPAATIISNYLTLLVALSVFTLIGSGARQLTLMGKNRPTLQGIRVFAAIFIVIGVLFTHLIMRNWHGNNPYYLNSAWLMLTYIAPYLFAWFMGLLCAYELFLYARSVKAVLYRRGLNQLAYGLGVVIAGDIAVQFVSSALANGKHLTVGLIVLIDYTVLLAILVGLIVMALGTKKLQKIEEV